MNKKSLKYQFFNYFQILKYKTSLDRKSQILRYIEKKKPSRILEIGVHTGEFALRMLKCFKNSELETIEYTGIDLFSEMHTKKINVDEISLWPDNNVDVLRKIQSKYPQVKTKLITGFSESAILSLKNSEFDLIFIDGGHSYSTVKNDWVASSRLLSPNGAIFFDDYTNSNGEKFTGFGIKKVVDDIDQSKWKVEVLPIRDYFLKEWGILSLRIVKVLRKQ